MAKRRIRDELSITPLTSAVTSAMRELASDKRHAHTEIWARWRDIVGPEMYKRSFPVSLRGTVLMIGVANSAWLQEMSFLERAIVDRLAEEIGPGVVSAVKLVLDTSLDAPVRSPRLDDAADRSSSLPAPSDIGPELRAETERLSDPELRAAVERAIAAGLVKRK